MDIVLDWKKQKHNQADGSEYKMNIEQFWYFVIKFSHFPLSFAIRSEA